MKIEVRIKIIEKKESKMKRMREMEKNSEIKSAIEELSLLLLSKSKATSLPSTTDDGTSTNTTMHIPIKPFLFVSQLVLQVLDKLGPTMAVLRQDMDQNIQRLEDFVETDPVRYSNVDEILKKEKSEGRSRKRKSCTSAFVWLTRSLDFTVKLLELLVKDLGVNIEEAVGESYKITLKPWHGWISSIAFTVSEKLLPDNKTLISILMGKGEDHEQLKEDIHTFTSLLLPHLQHIHFTLKAFGVDDLKSI